VGLPVHGAVQQPQSVVDELGSGSSAGQAWWPWRSPTTVLAAQTRDVVRVCAAWPTGSKRYRGGRLRQGGRLRAARRAAGQRAGQPGVHHDAVALAGRGPDQAVAAPLVDLSPRPQLCRQGRGRVVPVPAQLRRCAAGRGRVRHQRRREDLDSGALPLPSHSAAGPGPHDAGRA
jgi:hypothetical protein